MMTFFLLGGSQKFFRVSRFSQHLEDYWSLQILIGICIRWELQHSIINVLFLKSTPRGFNDEFNGNSQPAYPLLVSDLSFIKYKIKKL